MDPPSASDPSPTHERAIRSFAQREDAERARAALADSNIASSIREFRVPDNVTGKLVARGCSLCVDSADAVTATRLLFKMPPSEAPGAGTVKPAGASRLRRRAFRPDGQKSSAFMIGFAMLCAAGMVIFGLYWFLRPKKPARQPADTEPVTIEEDLNGDTIPDVKRGFTANWVPLYHVEDRNYDSLWDHRWSWLKGKPSYRDIDLNFDGKYDERTTYDPEGQPFYIDTRPGESGPVVIRKIFRDGILWKILEDRDADTHFDHLTEFDDMTQPIREEELPKGSPENNPPPWPPPPAPVNEEEAEEK
jgi:hypothetical protein